MNARAMEPVLQEFILGDLLLHTRFSMAIELLARLVLASPRALTAGQLAEACGQSPRTVRTLLASLRESGLVIVDGKCKDAWSCPCAPESFTLADVFLSVSAAKTEPPSARKRSDADGAAHAGVELLLMQATMAVNQLVLQHLQSFDLSRLKAMSHASGWHAGLSASRGYQTEPI
ncbi:Rrf2 family transcriptional regulator [Noviherbaspirillum malthae]|jgi:DNA-binding IscR family transcriptional regulator|uniref:Rrf2 family transcriptional regulator n=1 Tax=Noviherbaspirillum malthae TaxID=1260987 RepID=UPI00188ECD0E|nr:Rrf2 family transcriptional regulator [Noviherbaspirillum malthae]